MPSIRELLQFVIDADATGAIRTFDSVEKASKKSLGAAETSTQKLSATLTKTGAAGLAFGAVLGAGMFKAAQAAGSLELSQRRLQGIFGDSAASVIKFTKEANKIGLSDKAAAEAAANIGEAARGLGIAADEAAGLTPQLVKVVVQLGLIQGMDTAAALETVNAAMRGEYDSLQRLVPAISNATIVQQALKETHKETAQQLTTEEKTRAALHLIVEKGSATLERSGNVMDSVAGKTAVAQANFQDLVTTLGAEFVPVVSTVLTHVGSLASGFGSLPGPIKEVAGAIVIATAAMSTIGGAASLVVGGLLKWKDAWNQVKGTMTKVDAQTGERVISNTGIAAAGAAIGVGILAATFQVLGDAAKESQQLVDGMTNEVKTSGKTLGEVAGNEFADYIGKHKDLRDALKATDISTREATAGIQGSKAEYAALVKPLKDYIALVEQGRIANDGDAQQRRIALAGLDDQREAFVKARTHIQETNKATDELRGHTKDTTTAVKELGDATTSTGNAQQDAKERTKALDDALKGMDESAKLVSQDFDAAGAGAKEFSDAIERSTGLDDQIAGAKDLSDAFGKFKETSKDLPDTIDVTSLALGKYNEKQTDAIDNLSKLSDQSTKYLSTLIESGATTDQVKLSAAALADSYTKQMKAAGLSEEQIKTYLQVLGLTPEQVETAIKLSGDAEARFRLQLLQNQIDALPPNVETKVTQKIIAGDYQGALAIIQAYANNHPITVFLNAALSNQAKRVLGALPGLPTAPLGASSQAAGVSAYSATPTGGLGSYNITINMPAGADGGAVIDAINRHTRRNGNPQRGWRPT